MWWMIGVGVVSILILLALPHFLRRGAGGDDQTEAVNNARQIGIALFEFEMEYGSFPNESTAAQVKSNNLASPLTLGGGSSNELFAQLLASGICQSESIFYAKTKSVKKPDNRWTTDATALAPGECGFAYIAGLSTAGDPSTPIAFGPVIPGTMIVDGKSNDRKAVVLKMDNSVTSVPIDASGKIIYRHMDLLDPRQSYWHGKAPDVRWPK